eukprot:GHVH01012224.1.p1 GENE.GHVH01012224.1~~GHVH01012224.1.p1  ORF type:complete len:409 (-),score=73.47 GHVH01012224.1:153-1379(-)
MQFLPLLLHFVGQAAAETWLPSHSFAEPLSASMRNDWYMGGESWPDVNGLTLIKATPNKGGWIGSREPLLTNSFQVQMAISVHSSPEETISAGDALDGNPGMMFMLHDPSGKTWPPQMGDFYGMYPSMDGHAIFFALTSREDKLSPSISFGPKGLNRVQTPLPRGIYWNYLDKKEFEVMLDVLDGREVHGYIRSKSSDRWTQAFSETLPEDDIIPPQAHILMSAANGGMSVKYTISRLSVTSQDTEQPGYQREKPTIPIREEKAAGSESIGDVRDALIHLTELFANELGETHHFFEEQRNQNKHIIGLLESIKGSIHNDAPSSSVEDSIVSITSKMESLMEQKMSSKPDKDTIRKVESMFHSLAKNNETAKGSANRQLYLMSAALLLVSAGMGYVIFHMKKLEKKHIL